MYGFFVIAFEVLTRAQAQQTIADDHMHLAAADPEKARDSYIRYMGANPGETPERAELVQHAGLSR